MGGHPRFDLPHRRELGEGATEIRIERVPELRDAARALPVLVPRRHLSPLLQAPAEQRVQAIQAGFPSATLGHLQRAPRRFHGLARAPAAELGLGQRLRGADAQQGIAQRVRLAHDDGQGRGRGGGITKGGRLREARAHEGRPALARGGVLDRPVEVEPGRLALPPPGVPLSAQHVVVRGLLAVSRLAHPGLGGIELRLGRVEAAHVEQGRRLLQGEFGEAPLVVQLFQQGEGLIEGRERRAITALVLVEDSQVAERHGHRVLEVDLAALLECVHEGLEGVSPVPLSHLEEPHVLHGEDDPALVADLPPPIQSLPPIDERVVVFPGQEQGVSHVVVALRQLRSSPRSRRILSASS